jgi:hypothetical protein
MCGPVNVMLATAIEAMILAYPSKQIARIVLLWETLVMRFSVVSLRSGWSDGTIYDHVSAGERNILASG